MKCNTFVRFWRIFLCKLTNFNFFSLFRFSDDFLEVLFLQWRKTTEVLSFADTFFVEKVSNKRFEILLFLMCCQPITSFFVTSQHTHRPEIFHIPTRQVSYLIDAMQQAHDACVTANVIYTYIASPYSCTCMAELMDSRSERISARFLVPSTLRSVVCARSRVEWCAFSTFATDTVALLTR